MANNWKINETVDLQRGIDGVKVWPHALLVTGDENAHEWNVKVMDNGKDANLSGEIRAYFVRSDGATVTATGSTAGNIATVTLPEACYAYEGDLSAVMQLIESDVSVTLSALLLRVRQISTDIIVDPGSEIPSLDDLLAQIEKIKQATKDANSAATGANAAKDAANTAASSANSAASAANKAKTDADAATKKANDAATAANTAKDAANTAASSANTATSKANEAATKATTAATNADTAAGKANTATSNANAATKSANDAASAANASASKADTATSNANTATERANAAAQAAEEIVVDKNIATKDYVAEQIDGIEIGGLNLFGFDKGLVVGPMSIIMPATISFDRGIRGLVAKANERIEYPSKYGFRISNIGFDGIGGYYTFSAYISASKDCSFIVDICDQGNVRIDITTEPKRFVVTAIPRLHITPDDINGFVDFQITDDGLDADTIITFKDVKIERGNKATDWTPAPEDLDAKIDNIEIGGTNLIIGSKDFSGDKWSVASGNIKDISVDPEKYRGLTVLRKETAWNYPRYEYAFEVGKTYTLSLYAKCDAESGIKCQFTTNTGTLYTTVTLSKDWERYSYTFTAVEGDKTVSMNGIVNGNAYLCGYKIELGNKPTDWSPAPEDVDAKIDAIEIGGRNYALNTSDEWSEWYTPKTNVLNTTTMITQAILPAQKTVGDEYTCSIEIQYDGITAGTGGNFMIATQGDVDGSFSTNSVWDYSLLYTIIAPSDGIYRYHTTEKIDSTNKDSLRFNLGLRFDYIGSGRLRWRNIKVERGNKATDWSPAPEDIDRAISRRSAVTYDYGGRNLKEVFGTAEALHNALAAEDYSNIAIGDYWPITLNGTFWDWGSYTVQSGGKYYSNNTLQTQAGTTAAAYEGVYESDTAVSFRLSGTTYYASTSDCLPYYTRACNTGFKLDVAGINLYWRYGDSGELTGYKPHIVFVSRDGFPIWMHMMKDSRVWENSDIDNPWLGSAMFKTLNDETHGVLPLVAATDVGAYIYAGPNNNGMRAKLETKSVGESNAKNMKWYDRGKLFIPSVTEVYGTPFFSEKDYSCGLANQFAIFRDSRRHISKGGGDNGARTDWWLSTSVAGTTSAFTYVGGDGSCFIKDVKGTSTVPICFIFA